MWEARMAPKTILLVEGDLDTRQHLDGVLTSAGYSIEAAVSAKPDAFVLGDIVRPQIVVLALRLGDELSLDLAEHLKASFDARVILVCERGDGIPADHVTRLHPMSVLTKPIQPLDVIAAVEEALAA